MFRKRPDKRQTPPDRPEAAPGYQDIYPAPQRPSEDLPGAFQGPFRAAGAVLAALSALAALGLLAGVLCLGDVCREAHLWGRPLSAWGVAVHVLTAAAFIYAPRSALIPWTALVLLAHGAVYLSDPVPCPVCVGTLVAEALMVALAVPAGAPRKPFPPGVAAAAVAAALVLVFAPGPLHDYALPVVDRGSLAATGAPAPVGREEAPAQVEPPAPDGPWERAPEAPHPEGREKVAPAQGGPPPDGTAALQPCHVRLIAPDGAVVFADLCAAPVVVFSASCRHCDRVLEAAGRSGTVLAATRAEGVEEKLAAAGLSGAEWYVLAEPVQGVPALLYWDGGRQVALGASAVLAELSNKRIFQGG